MRTKFKKFFGAIFYVFGILLFFLFIQIILSYFSATRMILEDFSGRTLADTLKWHAKFPGNLLYIVGSFLSFLIGRKLRK